MGLEKKYDNVTRKKRNIFTNNFVGGVAWGLGVTVGLSVFLALLAFIAARVEIVPVVGDFTQDVINYILENSGQIPGRP